MTITAIDTSALDAGASTTASRSTTGPAAMQDTFLKLLVAQLTNQDPMNPMDNAQMTTQMAQINTVTGIQELNLSMQTLAEQFSVMQTLQGTQMIGRSVLVPGDRLAQGEDGAATGAFDLAGAAASVKVEVLTPGGAVVAAVDMGALEQGRHSFSWDASGYDGDPGALTFRVAATNAGDAVASTALTQARVTGTGAQAGALTLTLDDGSVVNYANISAVL
ncbi:flagellar hook assembly protein FlgD [Comamonas flocculans]|uniref:Basal-body rod modification protein FlgD n=1 Tax=Comamonas flocculans TaxID=2597701 RepID=A0A5B8RV27_9BURK|nr:flagellar hook capping FlgD N-terminal domain-containing protein [Comamonas flocculans]QEA12592.1 flagellar hook assembly protein FlgD [Comamonas flocculans]